MLPLAVIRDGLSSLLHFALAQRGCGRVRALPGHRLTTHQHGTDLMVQYGLFEYGDLELPDERGSDWGRAAFIDLHRHLLGSVSPISYVHIVQDHSLPIQFRTMEEVERALIHRVPVDGLRAFFSPWRILSRLISTPDILESVAYFALREAAGEGLQYVEFRASWGMTGREPYSVDSFLRALERGFGQASKESEIVVNLILGLTRHVFGRFPPHERHKRWAQILSSAVKYPELVVGVDISGIEDGFPITMFRDEIAMARECGLKITVHAGETTGPAEISRVLDAIRPDRIGHGLSSVAQPELLDRLVRQNIAVEVCPTSNWLTGAVPDVVNHPLVEMEARGLNVVVCTDNPAICRTTLAREHSVAVREMNLGTDVIERWQHNALESAFCREETRQMLRRSMEFFDG